MSQSTIKVEIVSAEKDLFNGEATLVVVTATLGEIGILPGHAPLLAQLKPGQVRLHLVDKTEEIFYISGGFIEVQPDLIIILADTAERAENMDEAAAFAAQERAKQLLQKQAVDIDYARARAELAEAAAQIAAIRRIRKLTK